MFERICVFPRGVIHKRQAQQLNKIILREQHDWLQTMYNVIKLANISVLHISHE